MIIIHNVERRRKRIFKLIFFECSSQIWNSLFNESQGILLRRILHSQSFCFEVLFECKDLLFILSYSIIDIDIYSKLIFHSWIELVTIDCSSKKYIHNKDQKSHQNTYDHKWPSIGRDQSLRILFDQIKFKIFYFHLFEIRTKGKKDGKSEFFLFSDLKKLFSFDKLLKKRDLILIESELLVYKLEWILIFIEIWDQLLSFLVLLLKNVNLNQIIDHLCIFIVNTKGIFEVSNTFWSVSIPVFTESVASENFVIGGIRHFHSFWKVLSGFFPVVFFHF